MGSANSEDAPFPLSEADKWVLSQTDEEYKYHDWEDLRQIVGKLPAHAFNYLYGQVKENSGVL
jgi:hypothetical protein